MSGTKPETVFNIEDLFADFNGAFISASLQLGQQFSKEEWKDSPFVYHMPRMHLSLRLVLSHSDGKVKGVFKKESSERSEEVTSSVEIDVVAVPRAPQAA